MNVSIPSALQSYTGASQVEASGANLTELFAALDTSYPGIRFRMIDEQDRFRRHMRCFVNGEQVYELCRPLSVRDEVIILQALSGG
ncbi:MoaD/ThiS family protein [Sphingobium sp. EM0848]|uniref:MoaD/ThiS family protein n=1 Tax=Sphingobium sp. EM0848 TaxID=2743473 RepID=UPI00159C279E